MGADGAQRARELRLNNGGSMNTTQIVAELLSTKGEPPEWVRFLAIGPNKARDGRVYTVADAERVVRLTNNYKGSIDLIVDFEHQFDHSAKNGQPAPAAAWIKELATKGPDGTPGIWARIEWLASTAAMIKERKYRYLSAAVNVDADNVVQFLPRASLTNQPALDTATALFSTQQEEGSLNALISEIAKRCGVDVTALGAMSIDEVVAALSKPVVEKLSAELGGGVPLSVHQDVTQRLATLTEQARADQVAAAMRAGKLTPAMREWALALPLDSLTVYLSTAPVIVAPGETQHLGGVVTPSAPLTVETLSVEQKAEARRFGVTEQTYCDAINQQSATGR